MVNILNLGHTTATVDLSLKNGKSIHIKNLMTSNKMNTSFDIPSEGVLLVEVAAQ
ncbi:hypothetical protein P4S67_11345 [Pseudoalteromonas sp. B137]